ncbi:MAG: hypothetical protein JKP96_01250 [Oceanicaulis sp.]|jgi:hypothetical protein|nr:hypothetical protein [Oceanicaulis sp.]
MANDFYRGFGPAGCGGLPGQIDVPVSRTANRKPPLSVNETFRALFRLLQVGATMIFLYGFLYYAWDMFKHPDWAFSTAVYCIPFVCMYAAFMVMMWIAILALRRIDPKLSV